jgi:hypothetical protein
MAAIMNQQTTRSAAELCTLLVSLPLPPVQGGQQASAGFFLPSSSDVPGQISLSFSYHPPFLTRW